MRKIFVLAAAAAMAFAGYSHADEITFKNGDKLTGSIIEGGEGKIQINAKVLGIIKVDMMDVETFTAEKPLTLKLNDGSVVRNITGGKGGAIEAAAQDGKPARSIKLKDIDKINPGEPHWVGTVTAGGGLTRGNTDTDALNITAHGVERREQDRFTVDGQYNFAKSKDPSTGVKSTTAENWMLEGNYAYFFDPKLYGFGDVLVAKDRVAALDWRVAPGVGVGYQWVESEKLNFNTEAAVEYFYEKYTNGTKSSSEPALRLAYHVDHKFNDHVQVFHNMKYFPKLDSINDFYLTTDLGVRLLMYKNFFAEAKAQLDHNNHPAIGRQKDDTKYVFSVGWTFE